MHDDSEPGENPYASESRPGLPLRRERSTFARHPWRWLAWLFMAVGILGMVSANMLLMPGQEESAGAMRWLIAKRDVLALVSMLLMMSGLGMRMAENAQSIWRALRRR